MATGEKELVRVHAIGNGTSQDRKPVEYNRRFIAIVQEQLAQHIENDRNEANCKYVTGDTGNLANN